MESADGSWGCLPLCIQLVGLCLLASTTKRKHTRPRFQLNTALFALLRTKMGCARILARSTEYAPRFVWKQALENLNDPIRPVLKHGPRSLTHVRAFIPLVCRRCQRNCWELPYQLPTFQTSKRLSMSMRVRTRKMVNYACEGSS